MKCSDVTCDMRGEGYGEPYYHCEVGDLIWDFKGGGHIIVAEVLCGSPSPKGGKVDCACGGHGRQPCPSLTFICECGEDGSWRDHHYVLLSRR
jgi:hypothetical protein